MSIRLPLAEPHKKAYAYCTYCPKLSRFSCPVSTVHGRETTTPWGKMASVHHVAAGHLPVEPTHAAPWYACTACMRCRTFCDHKNDVGLALYAARAEAVRLGVAPEAAVTALRQHPRRERRASELAQEIFGRIALRKPAATIYFPGCTSLVRRPDAAKSDLAVLNALTNDENVSVETASCCGLPLLEAGDQAGFLSRCRALVDRLGNAERIVVGDPGCLHTLKVRARDLGISHDLPLMHVTELAADYASEFRSVRIDGPVRYHDACRLGRGLGIYDQPRILLKQVLGGAPLEFAQRRDRSECSGAGGLLPQTDPDAAQAIARERLTEHGEAGGGALVTACPGSARWFDKHAENVTVFHLSELLARALP